MNMLSNRFSVLALERSRTPPYPPTPLTEGEVAHVKKIDSDMKAAAAAATTAAKYRPPALRAASASTKVTASLDSSNVEQFPTLGPSRGLTVTKAWSGGQQSFKKKVADLAERETAADMQRKLDAADAEAETRRRRLRQATVVPLSGRFRRPLESILTEDMSDDNDMNGFEDEEYDPSIHYEGANTQEEEDASN